MRPNFRPGLLLRSRILTQKGVLLQLLHAHPSTPSLIRGWARCQFCFGAQQDVHAVMHAAVPSELAFCVG